MKNKEVKNYEKNEGFARFKKKLLREHRIKSLLFGVAGGLAGAAISIAACRFANPSAMVYAAPIATAAGLAAAFAAAYFIKKPTDKKIAARLDKELNLQEKVSTRVEFEGKDGLILNKQREDATVKLDEKPVKAVQRKLASVTIPVLVVAAGLFAGSFFMPNIDQFPSHIKDPINSSNIGSVDSIVHVIASNAKEDIDDIDPDTDVNDKIDQIIDRVQNDLDGETDENKRNDIVEAGKDDIDKIVDDANSKDEIGDELVNSDDDALKLLGEAIKAGDEDKITIALGLLKDEINELNGQKLVDKLHAIAAEIRKALENSQIPEGDPLRDALKKLADEFDKEADELQKNLDKGQDTSDQTKDNLDKDIDEANKDINDSINQQNKNQAAGETAKDALDQMKDPTQNGQNGNSGDQEGSGEQGSGEGQGGSGEQGSGEQGSGEGEGGSGEQGSGEQGSGGQGSGNQGNSGNNGNNGSNGSNGGNGVQDGDPTGEGAGGGDGSVKYPGNDHVYTDQGDTKYGDVIDGSNGDAQDDCDQNGDDDINAALKDYFDELYGDHNKNNP